MLTTPRPSASVWMQVVDVEHRLAEELVAALLLEREQAALDRADRRGARRCRSSVCELLRVVADVLQHRAQVLQVEQQQAVVVGDLEHQRQHAVLRVVQVEQARRAAAAPCRRPSRAPGGPARRTRPRTRRDSRRTAASSSAELLRAARRASAIDAAGWRCPARSPFTSAMKTGTPMRAEALGQHLQASRSCRCRWRRRSGRGDWPMPAAAKIRPRRSGRSTADRALGGSGRQGGPPILP